MTLDETILEDLRHCGETRREHDEAEREYDLWEAADADDIDRAERFLAVALVSGEVFRLLEELESLLRPPVSPHARERHEIRLDELMNFDGNDFPAAAAHFEKLADDARKQIDNSRPECFRFPLLPGTRETVRRLETAAEHLKRLTGQVRGCPGHPGDVG